MEISDIDPANIEFRFQEAPDENSDYCVMKSLLDGKSISIKLPMKNIISTMMRMTLTQTMKNLKSRIDILYDIIYAHLIFLWPVLSFT